MSTHNTSKWKKEFDETYPPVTIGYDGNETDYFRREWTRELIEKTLHQELQKAREHELAVLATHLDRQLYDYTSVSVDSIYRYIEERHKAIQSELDQPLPVNK